MVLLLISCKLLVCVRVCVCVSVFVSVMHQPPSNSETVVHASFTAPLCFQRYSSVYGPTKETALFFTSLLTWQSRLAFEETRLLLRRGGTREPLKRKLDAPFEERIHSRLTMWRWPAAMRNEAHLAVWRGTETVGGAWPAICCYLVFVQPAHKTGTPAHWFFSS